MPRTIITRLASILFALLVALPQAHASEEGNEILSLFGAPAPELPPSQPLMSNVHGRDAQSLNGPWNIVVDEHNLGARGLLGGAYYTPPAAPTGMELVEFSFDARRQLQVPGDWNSQDERLFRYRDIVWYQRDFALQPEAGKRYFLHFDGANYHANVYLNGEPLASHRGGYTAFNVEITDAVQAGSNYLTPSLLIKLHPPLTARHSTSYPETS